MRVSDVHIHVLVISVVRSTAVKDKTASFSSSKQKGVREQRGVLGRVGMRGVREREGMCV